MRVQRHLAHGLLTAVAVVIGLLLVRAASSSYAPSLTSEFLANRLTYVYVFVATAIAFTGVGYVLGRRIDQLKRLSATDSLTGLANRRAFQTRLRDEWLRAKRYATPLSLLLIDVDGLKRVNDEYGHAAGDDVLKAAARAITTSMRGTDHGARWGGDEFAIVAPNTATRPAQHLAQRLLGHMSDEAKAREAAVTISVGLATYDPQTNPSMSVDALQKAADAALYQAKSEGRNRVKIA